MTPLLSTLLALGLPLALACSNSPSAAARDDSPTARHTANFELVCRSSNTRERSALFCLRHDTRNGDVVRIDHDRLPVSNGPTAAATAEAGRYRLECEATSGETRSDVYCVRLDTETGDLLLVALPKVRVIPVAGDAP